LAVDGEQFATTTPPTGGMSIEIAGFGGGANFNPIYAHVYLDIQPFYNGGIYIQRNFS
jgi:hypothetical protein